MSKVKNIDGYDVNKTKLKHNLRRVETKRKKRERIKKAEAGVYPWMKGYSVHDEELIREYEKEIVPETTRPVYHIEWIDVVRYYDGEPERVKYPKYIKVGEEVVPGHVRRKFKGIKKVPVSKRPIRLYAGKIKYWKNLANRKIRRANYDEETTFKKGNYKKFYDLKWLLW